MKKLFIIGGSMGVGKTAACNILKTKLKNSVFLDGDWCWDAHPFIVNDETKAMVMDNICYLLNNFLKCSAYDNIVFCWVLHEQNILNDLLSRLNTNDAEVYPVSITCDPETLKARLRRDIDSGLRLDDILDRSVRYLEEYSALDTIKIDNSNLSPEQTADLILSLSQ